MKAIVLLVEQPTPLNGMASSFDSEPTLYSGLSASPADRENVWCLLAELTTAQKETDRKIRKIKT